MFFGRANSVQSSAPFLLFAVFVINTVLTLFMIVIMLRIRQGALEEFGLLRYVLHNVPSLTPISWIFDSFKPEFVAWVSNVRHRLHLQLPRPQLQTPVSFGKLSVTVKLPYFPCKTPRNTHRKSYYSIMKPWLNLRSTSSRISGPSLTASTVSRIQFAYRRPSNMNGKSLL